MKVEIGKKLDPLDLHRPMEIEIGLRWSEADAHKRDRPPSASSHRFVDIRKLTQGPDGLTPPARIEAGPIPYWGTSQYGSQQTKPYADRGDRPARLSASGRTNLKSPTGSSRRRPIGKFPNPSTPARLAERVLRVRARAMNPVDAAIETLMRRTAEDIIRVGTLLNGMKERLGHGNFLRWLSAKFEMSQSTAYNFIAVAEKFSGKLPTVGNLSPKALYELASAEPDIRAEIERRIAAGEIVSAAPSNLTRQTATSLRVRDARSEPVYARATRGAVQFVPSAPPVVCASASAISDPGKGARFAARTAAGSRGVRGAWSRTGGHRCVHCARAVSAAQSRAARHGRALRDDGGIWPEANRDRMRAGLACARAERRLSAYSEIPISGFRHAARR